MTESRPIDVFCDSCGQAFKVKSEAAGRRVLCPGCKQPTVAPKGKSIESLTPEEGTPRAATVKGAASRALTDRQKATYFALVAVVAILFVAGSIMAVLEPTPEDRPSVETAVASVENELESPERAQPASGPSIASDASEVRNLITGVSMLFGDGDRQGTAYHARQRELIAAAKRLGESETNRFFRLGLKHVESAASEAGRGDDRNAAIQLALAAEYFATAAAE